MNYEENLSQLETEKLNEMVSKLTDVDKTLIREKGYRSLSSELFYHDKCVPIGTMVVKMKFIIRLKRNE